MPFTRKYNTLLVTGTTAIQIPIIKRGVVDFAVSADWTPAAGDVKILVDNTAAANVTNLPTAKAGANTGAIWEFVLTAAELSCKQAIIIISDAATKAIEDQCFIVETFGNASAMYAADFSLANLPANVVQLLGTAWLTPGTAGTPDVNVKLWNALTAVALPLIPTIAGRTLDVSATGEAGVDWANVGAPTTALNLSGTTVKTATDVATATTAIQAKTDNLPSDPADESAIEAAILAALNVATIPEPTGVPSATPTIVEALGALMMALREKVIVDSNTGKKTYHNAANTAITTKPIADAGGVYTETKMGAP